MTKVRGSSGISINIGCTKSGKMFTGVDWSGWHSYVTNGPRKKKVRLTLPCSQWIRQVLSLGGGDDLEDIVPDPNWELPWLDLLQVVGNHQGPLMLDHNELTYIPPLISRLTQATELHMSHNQIETLPSELGKSADHFERNEK